MGSSNSINKGKLCATTLGLLACAAAGAQEVPAPAPPQQPLAAEQAAPEAAPVVEGGTIEAAPAETAPTAEAEAASTPDAQDAFAGDEISEVIVTARRIQERLQDVPISITVFNQDQLTDRNVTSGSDLATYTPSLASNSRFGTENASFSLRGFSQEQRTTASVGVYFAEVVAPRAGSVITGGDGAGPGSFFDLANVQVLKGPQGTLFGRNTTGGAVLLVPQKPTSNFEGFVENSIGNYDLQHTTAVVNVPVSDSVRIRVGVDRNQREGYMSNNSQVGPNDFNDIGYTAYRFSVVADLAENLENYTIASYSDSRTNGSVPSLLRVDGTNAQNTTYRNSFPFNALLADQLARGGDEYTVSSAAADAYTQNRQWQLINTTTWNVTDALTIKNVASYAELQNDVRQSFYGGDLRMPAVLPLTSTGQGIPVAAADIGLRVYDVGSAAPPGLHTADQSTLSEELQFLGNAFDNALVWQAGGYFEQSRALSPNGSQSQQFIHCDNAGVADCYDVLGKYVTQLQQGNRNYVGSLGYQVGEIDFENFGLYAQSTYSVTDALKATAGIRYTSDEMTGTAINGRYIFTGANYDTPAFYCSNLDSGQATGPGSTGPDGNPTVPGVDPSLCRVSYSKKTEAPTWVLGLDYKATDNVLLYGKWSRGYRQGGVAPVSAGPAAVWDAEQVDTFELGFKSDFRGPVRGSFNVAAFYNDFRDQQLSAGFQQTNAAAATFGSVPPNVGIVNAGSSSIYGTEIETVLIPFRGLNVSLSYAWLKSEIKEVEPVATEPPYDVALPLAYEGDPLPYTSEHKISSAIFYTLPVDSELGEISFGPTVSYQSEYLVDGGARFVRDKAGNPAPSPYGEVAGRTLVNFNVNWTGVYGTPVDVGLFVTNLTDKTYYTSYTGGLTRFGYEAGYVGEPRMVGARVRVGFGN